jgi:hypothetical protein
MVLSCMYHVSTAFYHHLNGITNRSGLLGQCKTSRPRTRRLARRCCGRTPGSPQYRKLRGLWCNHSPIFVGPLLLLHDRY